MVDSIEHEREHWLLVLDESSRTDVMTVGGLMLPLRATTDITASWQQFKCELGLQPTDELKYTLGQRHPTRLRLDDLGVDRATLVPAMLDVTSDLDILLVANTLVDYRKEGQIVDLYLDAFGRVLRWFGNQVERNLRGVRGPHVVLVDKPPEVSEDAARDLSWRFQELEQHRARAAFHRYQQLWSEPQEFGYRRRHGTPFRDLDFFQTLVSAHAKHSDLLQIADVVVGCVRDFCHYCLTNAEDDGHLPSATHQHENLYRIAPRIRNGQGIKGYGFDLFPLQHPASVPLIRLAENIASAARMRQALPG